tara:strand:- start:1024 stop:1761 length:738 start_codon:yes stop_codon:yes gene_type:complete
MKKPFSRIGGKSLIVKELENLLPNNYEDLTYVEPFAGGASLYFYKNSSRNIEILNDLDDDIYTLLNGFKTYKIDKINNSMNKIPRTKDFFNKLKDSKPADKYSKFIRLLFLKKNSFFGLMRAFMARDNSNFSNFPDYFNRMKNTKVYHESYDKIIKKYDSKNTIFYLDPPYEKSEGIYENPYIDYIELANILRNIKGAVLLSINYNKDFIKLFSFLKYKIIKTKYADPLKGGRTREMKELIFTNY